MLKIIKLEKLSKIYDICPRDSFRLSVDGQIVNEQNIFGHATQISYWALVKIKDNLGYLIGNESLEEDLIQNGFSYAK
jgi:hypothetical protein